MTNTRRITGFHQTAHGDWVAELECGHTRHMRHRPPYHVRPWVMHERGRSQRLGTALRCSQCLPEY